MEVEAFPLEIYNIWNDLVSQSSEYAVEIYLEILHTIFCFVLILKIQMALLNTKLKNFTVVHYNRTKSINIIWNLNKTIEKQKTKNENWKMKIDQPNKN